MYPFVEFRRSPRPRRAKAKLLNGKGKGRTDSAPPTASSDLLPGYDADLHRIIHENERKFIHTPLQRGRGAEDPLDNIQPLPLYPAQTSPLGRGVEWPRRSVNTTLSRTSASLGVVLSGSYTRRATASKWRYPSASWSIQSLLVRPLALLSLHSSFPNPHFSIWRTLCQIPPVVPPRAPGSDVPTGLRVCRPRKFSATIWSALPCSLRTSFGISRPPPARIYACVVPPTYGQSFPRHILWITILFLCLPVSWATPKATVHRSVEVALRPPDEITLVAEGPKQRYNYPSIYVPLSAQSDTSTFGDNLGNSPRSHLTLPDSTSDSSPPSALSTFPLSAASSSSSYSTVSLYPIEVPVQRPQSHLGNYAHVSSSGQSPYIGQGQGFSIPAPPASAPPSHSHFELAQTPPQSSFVQQQQFPSHQSVQMFKPPAMPVPLPFGNGFDTNGQHGE